MIKAQPRQGWAAAAKRAHENGDDELVIPDVVEDEKFEDWTWSVSYTHLDSSSRKNDGRCL